MKNYIILFLIFFLSKNMYSQSENYATEFQTFQENYNAENYVDIFNSFSKDMQNALPLENTKEFFASLKAQVGKIVDKEFIEYQDNTSTLYKTQFENAVLGIYLTIDNQHKISGILIQPYTEPVDKKSKKVNALDNYPKNIVDIIYSQTNNLPNNTQLSIALIQKGKTAYYGIQIINDSIKPIQNQDKIFEIGSISKVFTSSVLAALVAENKMKLSDQVNSFYPFEFKDSIKLTLESLANHTSGLERLPSNLDLSVMSNPYKSYGKSELKYYLKNQLTIDNTNPPTYAYSNLGAGLLGYTVGVSQQSTLNELLQEKIFDKYGMNKSFTSSHNLENDLVRGLEKNGTPASNWDFDVLLGAGGILSTTEDLSKFVLAQFNPKNTELTLTRKPSYTIDKKNKMGLGWHITEIDANNIYWHNGGTGGYSSMIALDVDHKSGVIILSNVSDINKKIDGLGFDLMKELDK